MAPVWVNQLDESVPSEQTSSKEIPLSGLIFLSLFLFKYLFIWFHGVLVAIPGKLHSSLQKAGSLVVTCGLLVAACGI